MSNTVNVYWASVPDEGIDWSILFDEPDPLINELVSNKNKNNSDNNLLRCPAVTDLFKNVFVIRAPLDTSASFIVKDGMVSGEMKTEDNRWIVNRPPSFNNQLLAMYRHPIVFFSETDLDITLTDPYFSNASHKAWGAIVPGIYNCGSWFRPVQIEFNVWEGNLDLSLQEGEPIAYVKFNTDKKVILKRFVMTESLVNEAKICSSAGRWEPKVSLLKRYQRFRSSKRDKFVLKQIKDNLL